MNQVLRAVASVTSLPFRVILSEASPRAESHLEFLLSHPERSEGSRAVLRALNRGDRWSNGCPEYGRVDPIRG